MHFCELITNGLVRQYVETLEGRLDRRLVVAEPGMTLNLGSPSAEIERVALDPAQCKVKELLLIAISDRRHVIP